MSDDNKGVYTTMMYLQHAQWPTQEASWPALTFVAVCGFSKRIFTVLFLCSQLDLIAVLLKLIITLLKVRSSKWKIAHNQLRIGRSRHQANRALYVVLAIGDDKEVMLANKAVDLLLYIDYILSWRHSQWMSKGCNTLKFAPFENRFKIIYFWILFS